MRQITFDDFFRDATRGKSPYEYQRRLACGESEAVGEGDRLTNGATCRSQLINIPTGLGKTAAVMLAWLWNRIQLQSPKWPRRIVYCLPMRTLVEQTATEARNWIKNLDATKLIKKGLPRVIILMGGEELEGAADNWDLYPEENAILIGTQDMLLSRALNRGYGMSRYRWPMHFGLLNNDCLWVMDETQLMGVGVETSAQLDGFRHMGTIPTCGLCPTWWMSATLNDARLTTVDHPKPPAGWLVEKLSAAEQSSGRPHDLITAAKKLSRAALRDAPAPLTLNSATKDYAGQLAKLVKERHQTGTLTLVVVNRVKRAREIFEALTTGSEKVALIHSRFRPVDRERHTKLLFSEGDRIVIATQAVEAGVDVSARLLITELAPWSSLVQRIGRCNRRADIPGAEVLWVDIQPKDDKDDLLRPYSETELKKARAAITPLTDASPQALCEVAIAEENVIRPVIRRRDLVDLFDTTPDICGQDLDVSRYIRDGDDNDVQFFWRSVQEDAPTDKEPPPNRDELCRVSIGDAVKFLGKKPRSWCWNPLSEKWEKSKIARPGVVYLLDVKSGGYGDATGWTGDPKDKPTPHPPKDGELDSYDGNRLTFSREWQTLAEHTQLVVRQMTALAAAVTSDTVFATALRTAALWHDIGKAHVEFQKMLCNGDPERAGTLFAKSANKAGRCGRRAFRHELASALAWLLAGPADAGERDLIAYLIAAHHGKVRLSIRSLPNETGNPRERDALFARGIWQGDALPEVKLGDFTTPQISLDLSFMRMGEGRHGPSWLARTVALRDRLGPFRLAYFEAILRAADARASMPTTVTPPLQPSAGGSSESLACYPQAEAERTSALREEALTRRTASLMSHQSLDDLALLYFRAIADKIRRDPSLLRIPLENIQHWREQSSISSGSERGIRVWERLIVQRDLEALIALMTDPGEEGTRWRQYPVFVGILTPEESAAIRRQYEANSAISRGTREGAESSEQDTGPGGPSGEELREEPPAYQAASLSAAEKALVADLVEDGLSIQDKFRSEPLYKQSGKGHYASNTVEDVRKAKESKPKGTNR